MPLYDVECSYCGSPAEEFQPMGLAQPTKCSSCGRIAAHRVILHAPAIQTDCSFFRGSGSGLPANERLHKLYQANATRAGISTSGKRYEPGLVRPGMSGGIDPEAWVPEMEGRSYIKRKLRERGWGSEGRIEMEAREAAPKESKEPYRPAPDIVERAVNQTIQREKLTLTPSERTQLSQQTAKTLAGKLGE